MSFQMVACGTRLTVTTPLPKVHSPVSQKGAPVNGQKQDLVSVRALTTPQHGLSPARRAARPPPASCLQSATYRSCWNLRLRTRGPTGCANM